MYTEAGLKKSSTSKSGRTSWFEQHLFAVWKAIGGPVPYAFRTVEGDVRSLDAGCVGYLFNLSRPEVILHKGGDGFIDAVEPAGPLQTRYVQIEDRLVSAVMPQLQHKSEAKVGTKSMINGTVILSPKEGISASELDPDFDLDDPPDERRIQQSEQVIREGAEAFKRQMMVAWSERCAVTGTSVPAVLDAAHIYRYYGLASNVPCNGILLRTDIHRLFDRHLVGFRYDNGDLRIVVAASLGSSEYGYLDRKPVALPNDDRLRPDPRLIAHHLNQMGED